MFDEKPTGGVESKEQAAAGKSCNNYSERKPPGRTNNTTVPAEEVPESMTELMRLRWPSLQDRVCRAQRFNHDVITVILGYCDVDAFRAARCVSQLWMSAACTTLLLLDQQPCEEQAASASADHHQQSGVVCYQTVFPLGYHLLKMRRFWADRCLDPLTEFRVIYRPGHDSGGQSKPFSAPKLAADVNKVLRFPALAPLLAAPHAIYTASASSFARVKEDRMIVASAAGSSGHFRIWINDTCVMSRGDMRGTKRKKLVEKDGRLVDEDEEEEVNDAGVTDSRVIQYTFRKGTTYRVRAEADGYWHDCGWFINFNTQPYTRPMDAMNHLKKLMTVGRTQLWSAFTYEVDGRQQIRVKLPTDDCTGIGPDDGVILFLGVHRTVEWVFETTPRPGLVKAIVYSQVCGPSSCALRSLDGSVVSPHVFHLESASFEMKTELPRPFTELGAISRAIAVISRTGVADFTISDSR